MVASTTSQRSDQLLFDEMVSQTMHQTSPFFLLLLLLVFPFWTIIWIVKRRWRCVMTATMTSLGQIEIPQEIRERCGLREGDHFVVEDDPASQSLVVRKITSGEEWFEVYLECPEHFSIPTRSKQLYQPKHGLAD